MSLLKPKLDTYFFSPQYFDNIIKECPKLSNALSNLQRGLDPEPLNDYMLNILAFNIAYNSFYRGKRRTAIFFLRSVLDSTNLTEDVARSASLLEIQFCVALRNLQIASNLIEQLGNASVWANANCKQRDCLELLSSEARSPNFKHPMIVDDQQFHWFLHDIEVECKSGDPKVALNALIQRRNSLTRDQQRLADNAMGCILALSPLKNYALAETYFRSSMLRRMDAEQSNPFYTGCLPILPHILIYHVALMQLLLKKAHLALPLFFNVLPFANDPRTWLRIAECCVQIWKNNSNQSRPTIQEGDPSYSSFHFGACIITHKNLIKSALPSDKQFANPGCPHFFAHFCLKQASSLASANKESAYLLHHINSLHDYLGTRPERSTVLPESIMPPCDDDLIFIYPSLIGPEHVQDDPIKDEEWSQNRMCQLEKGVAATAARLNAKSSAPSSPKETRKQFTPDIPFSVVSASGYSSQSLQSQSGSTTIADLNSSGSTTTTAASPSANHSSNPLSFTRSCAVECLKKIIYAHSVGQTLSKTDSNKLARFLSDEPDVFSEVDAINNFPKFVEFQPDIAAELLLYEMTTGDNESLNLHFEILIGLEFSVQTLVTVNKFISSCETKQLTIPEDFLNRFITLCMSCCEQTEGNQLLMHRLVRMVCVFFGTLIRLKGFDSKPRLNEILNFTTLFLSLREATFLYQAIQLAKSS